jgi:hypothetical protein
MNHTPPLNVTIREASERDWPELVRLAALDSARLEEGPALIAEVQGRALAALSLAHGAVIADPFARTADLAALLRLRAGQLIATQG